MNTIYKFYKINTICFLIFLTAIFSQTLNAQETQPKNFAFGAELGMLSGTINNTVFALGFNADYLVAPTFSFGEFLTFSPSSDLLQISANTVAQFHIPVDRFELVPYMGIALIYGNVDAPPLSESDFTVGFPIGLMFTYPVGPQINVSARTQVSIYTLDYGAIGTDKSDVQFLVGFRYSP